MRAVSAQAITAPIRIRTLLMALLRRVADGWQLCLVRLRYLRHGAVAKAHGAPAGNPASFAVPALRLQAFLRKADLIAQFGTTLDTY